MEKSIRGLVYRGREPSFSATQELALDLAIAGQNLFITGGAGTGKTFLLRECVRVLEALGKQVVVCAPTGTAAVRCGGVTIHRLFGFKASACINPRSLEIVTRAPAALRSMDTLIIDEISMCRMDLFDAIVESLKKVQVATGRQIQVLCFGDFYQLPPVLTSERGERNLIERHYMRTVGRAYAFQAPGWKWCRFKVVELQTVFRQRDHDLIYNLNLVRKGDPNGLHFFLDASAKAPFDAGINLCGRNIDADAINQQKLAEIESPLVCFAAEKNGDVTVSDMIVPEMLGLKVGCRIMTTVTDQNGMYVNGSIGIVDEIRADRHIVKVCFGPNKWAWIRYHTWEVYQYAESNGTLERKVIGTYSQLPLKLAYAITIHKSQGATFEEVNLKPASWDPGQMYVALSRITAIDGLYLDGNLRFDSLKVDPAVILFYDGIAETEQSRQTAYPEDEPKLPIVPAYLKPEKNTRVAPESAKPEPVVEPPILPIRKEAPQGAVRKGGRPRRYRGATVVMRVPAEAKAMLEEALLLWSQDPECREIVARTRDNSTACK